MTYTAYDVAAVLRRELPGLGVKKLHKLLYYCQGHYLAHHGKPLFSETISAWDMGPVVGTFWRTEKDGEFHQQAPADLDNAAGNIVLAVVSRYGNLTGKDLEHLTHSESPWQLANQSREPGGRAAIRHDWMTTYFRTEGRGGWDEETFPIPEEEIDKFLDPDRIRRNRERPRPEHPDDIDTLRAMIRP